MSSRGPEVLWSRHALERLRERIGTDPAGPTARIASAIRERAAWVPGPHARQTEGEVWIALDGPKGKGTAVVVRDGRAWRVVTLRESETCTQGERAGEALTHRPFAVLAARGGGSK